MFKNRAVSAHWRIFGYPNTGDVWLVRFTTGEACVARVMGSDDLGGNLVDLSLQCLKWDGKSVFNRSYDFYARPGEHDIESWEKIGYMKEDEWKWFLAFPAYHALTSLIDKEMRRVAQVPCGLSGGWAVL